MTTRYALTIALSMFGLALGAGEASAATLDFNEVSGPVGFTYSEEGFSLSSGRNFGYVLSGHPNGKGSNALATGSGWSTRLVAEDGGTFDLEAIDLNGLLADPLGSRTILVRFDAYDAQGNLTATHTTGDVALLDDPWTTVEFGAGFTDVAYVEWKGLYGEAIQFDNIVVSQGGDVTSVPELDPGAAGSGVALLLGGSAVLFDRRRRSEA